MKKSSFWKSALIDIASTVFSGAISFVIAYMLTPSQSTQDFTFFGFVLTTVVICAVFLLVKELLLQCFQLLDLYIGKHNAARGKLNAERILQITSEFSQYIIKCYHLSESWAQSKAILQLKDTSSGGTYVSGDKITVAAYKAELTPLLYCCKQIIMHPEQSIYRSGSHYGVHESDLESLLEEIASLSRDISSVTKITDESFSKISREAEDYLDKLHSYMKNKVTS